MENYKWDFEESMREKCTDSLYVSLIRFSLVFVLIKLIIIYISIININEHFLSVKLILTVFFQVSNRSGCWWRCNVRKLSPSSFDCKKISRFFLSSVPIFRTFEINFKDQKKKWRTVQRTIADIQKSLECKSSTPKLFRYNKCCIQCVISREIKGFMTIYSISKNICFCL